MSEEKPDVNSEWLMDVRRIYLAGASGKLAELERAILGLEMNPAGRANERRLRKLLHNLIGSGASYGYPAVTETARAMSDRLKQRQGDKSAADCEILADLRALLGNLRRIFNDAGA